MQRAALQTFRMDSSDHMTWPSSWRRFEGTLPIRDLGIAREVATEQVRPYRGNAETVRGDGKASADAAILHQHLAVRPLDVFALDGSVGRKILEAPGPFALELGCTFANLGAGFRAKLRVPGQG